VWFVLAKLNYRPEIDGLRAVAVLSVLFYHAGFAVFGGGYVGVDVFFVISGYLITSLIVREVSESGGFQFGRFYLRRIRRLFPALLCTVLFSWVAAFLIFSPQQMQDFGASTIAALTSLSNVYFWFEADYFDTAVFNKPLLHTWSLSVEEQFYFIWPALIVFVLVKMRSAFALVILGLLCLASLGLAEYWMQEDREAAFYLLPARVVELGIGAALVWLPKMEERGNSVLEIGAFAGLAMIVWSIFTYSHDTLFPGVTSLLPCFGTALFIACSNAKWSSYLLRTQPMVWVGQISYSLYLVHWPVIVFYYAIAQDAPNTVGLWLIVFLSVTLGWMQYHFVETRFRHSVSGKDLSFAGMAAACAALIAVPSYSAYAHNGWQWRVPEARLVKVNELENRQLVQQDYCSSFAPEGTFAGDHRDIITCQNYRGKKHSIYIWGDSHALHLAAGFSSVYKNYNVHVLYQSGCVPQSGFAGYVRDFGSAQTQECQDRNRKALEAFKLAPPTHLFLTSAKRSSPAEIARATKSVLKSLSNTEHKVRLMSDFIRPGKSLLDCMNVPSMVLSDKDVAARCKGNEKDAVRELNYNERLAKLIPDMIDVTSAQCVGGNCKFVHKEKLLYIDSHHLNIPGSEYFIHKLRRQLAVSTKGWNTRTKAYQRRVADLISDGKAAWQSSALPNAGDPDVGVDTTTTGSISGPILGLRPSSNSVVAD
jgi:peptidoglycan/LPS O-acetylase OafA/YrhL